jgi:crotonobetainyl-CoA:carnitine CoA-transferase CaiB-like acyl-CoA transferase
VAAAPVIRGGEALDDGWLAENALVEGWDHPRLGPMITAKAFAAFSRTPAGFSRPTPELAEHSAEILAEYGIAPERIAALMTAGAVF